MDFSQYFPIWSKLTDDQRQRITQRVVGRKFVGEDYATHEVILYADSTGTLERFTKAPAPYTFDHTEWIYGADSLVVATLVDIDGAHRKVVALNAFTGDVLEMLCGEELWHPAVMSVLEFNFEHCVRQGLNDDSFLFDC